MTTPDEDLAARLSFIAASHDEIPTGQTVQKATAEMELRYHLHAAYHSGQLITLADHTRLVKEAVEAERAACAWTATSFLVGDPKNGIPLRGPMASEVAAAIRSRGVTV